MNQWEKLSATEVALIGRGQEAALQVALLGLVDRRLLDVGGKFLGPFDRREPAHAGTDLERALLQELNYFMIARDFVRQPPAAVAAALQRMKESLVEQELLPSLEQADRRDNIRLSCAWGLGLLLLGLVAYGAVHGCETLLWLTLASGPLAVFLVATWTTTDEPTSQGRAARACWENHASNSQAADLAVRAVLRGVSGLEGQDYMIAHGLFAPSWAPCTPGMSVSCHWSCDSASCSHCGYSPPT